MTDTNRRRAPQDFAPFLAFNRNGLDLAVEFSAKLPSKIRQACFDIAKKNTSDLDQYWDDEEKVGLLCISLACE